MGNGHDDLLKGIHVVAITHALARPWDVDISIYVRHPKKRPVSENLPPNTRPSTAVIQVTLITAGVESPILINMERNIQDIGVVVESFLDTISYDM